MRITKDWVASGAVADPVKRSQLNPNCGSSEKLIAIVASGFAMLVDGHFKTQYNSETAARKAAEELLALFPNLRVEIYNASTKVRTPLR